MENETSKKMYLTVELVEDVFAHAIKENDCGFSFLDESYETFQRIKRMNFLDDASKCVLGISLMYWSMEGEDMPCVRSFKRNHDFSLHDFYGNASYLEDDMRSVFGDSFVTRFTSSASFITDEFDAAFCIVNSLSRGFNICFLKRFGGDLHLQWLAALFNYMVVRMYMTKYGMLGERRSGFDAYADEFDSFTMKLDSVDSKIYHRLFARFMMWCRKRLSAASKILGSTFQPAFLDRMRSLAHSNAISAYLEDDMIWRDEASKDGKAKQTGKIGHRKTKKHTTENPDVSKNVNQTNVTGFLSFDKHETDRKQSDDNGSYYSYVFTVSLNGNRTTFRKKTSNGTWIVSGKGAEDPKHLEELRSLGYLPDGFNTSYIIEDKKGL